MTWLMGLVCLLLATSVVRADRNPTNCAGSALGITLFTSIPDVHIGDTLHYSINVFNGNGGSPQIACDATAIQAFIVTPDGVTNSIALTRTTLTNGQADFYTDVVSYVVRAQDVKPDGTLLATARDVGVIHQNDTDSVGGGFQGVNTEVNLPCVLITALCFGGVGENGAITFTGTVTNCGNNTLVGVTVTNFHDAGNFTVLFPTNLAIGQTANFSGSFTPLNPCAPSTAILTVRATDQFTSTPQTVTNFTTITCQNTLTPGIKVTKVCPAGLVSPGQSLVFSGSVSNTGNVTLTNIVVVNNQPAPNTPVFTLATLAPGEVANFSGNYLAPTNCSVTDTLTATAASRCGVGVSSVVSATCPILTTPQIMVTAVCPGTPILPGGTLTYSGTVRNNGNTTLTNVVVVSDRPAANTTVFTVATLAPGASANFTGTYTVPANACSVTTTFSGTGRDICTLIAVTNAALTTCTVTTAPAIAVTLTCPVVPASAGGPITYTGTVRNSGNVTLNNVFVVNNNPTNNTPVIGPITLLPGASANFTTSFTTPGDACSVSSTVTATGSDNCTTAMVTNTASTICTLIAMPAIVVTQTCPASPAVPGGMLTYSGTVSNAGNTTLTNVVVMNNLSGGTPVFTAVTMAPGAVSNFTGSYLTPTNCSSTSTSTATGRSICGVAVTGTVSTTCPILTTPLIAVTAACPGTPIVPGGSLTYSGTVRNTGNITLTNVVVVSDRPAANTVVFSVATLAPGAVANYTSTITVPTNACAVTAIFSGTGRDICTLNTVTNTVSTTCTGITAPAIAVTLVCPPAISGTPVNIALGRSATQSSTYAYQGFSFMAGLAVDGNTSGAYTDQSMSVADTAPNAWWQVDLGSVRNIGTVNLWSRSDGHPEQTSNLYVLVSDDAIPANLQSATNQAGVSVYYFPGNIGRPTAISINRTGRYVKVQLAGSGYLSLSEVQVYEPLGITPTVSVTYTGSVRNSGNVTLNNVTVVSSQSSPATVFTVASLAPGASANFTANVAAPGDACSVIGTVIATGIDNCSGILVTNTATATCPLITMPGIAVTQICPVSPAIPGGMLTYSGTVINAGNITLTNVVVMNNLSGATPVFTLASLASGAVANFTGSFLASTNCSITSISTVTAQSICGGAVTNSVTSTCPILAASAIIVTQTCPITPVLQGGILTYNGTVRNAGNNTLTNIVVVDNRPGTNTVVFTLATLAPGASANFTGSYVTHLDCCVDSSTLKASGQGCAGVIVTDTATRTCALITAPRLVVTKICTPGVLRPGDLLTYNGTVSNAGSITLINVTVVNNQPPGSSPVLGPVTLAPGESFNYAASYIVPPDFCGTDTVTASGLDVCTFLPVVNSVTTTCPVITPPPIIAVTKNCPVLPTPRGGIYAYTGTVSNPGTVTLVNVFVVDNYPTNNTPVIGPITLAPGASANFTGSSVAPVDCCEVIDTVTARGQSRCTGTNVTITATTVCPLLTTPRITLVQDCPPIPIPMGSVFAFSGYVTNTGDVVLTNVYVFSPQGTNTPVLGPIELAPGESEVYFGSYTVPFNICSVAVTASGQNVCGGNTVSNATTCPVATTPLIAVTENCPPGQVVQGSLVTYTGTVSNPGNITLTNILVFSSQPTNNSPVFGPITLAPGASAPFTGRYIATGGSNPMTNTTVVTNGSGTITTNTTVTITTNAPTPVSFGTINSISQVAVDRFIVGSNFNGLVYAPEDHGYAATQFYSLRKDTTGSSFFDTITASTGTTTDRFNASNRNFDSLAYAAPDVGYGPVIFYYLSHNNAGISTFGSITPGGTVGVTTDHFVVGSNFDALTFAATDLGYGANLFYYVRHDASGLSTFGTISPGLPGIVTDRFTVGTNVDALVFTDLTSPGFGANNFYYLRHDASGASTFGTILITSPSTALVTDRFNVGTNVVELAFTSSDPGSFGPNLFYYLRGAGTSYTTNTTTTYTTNMTTTYTTNTVVSFTTTNTVTATGMDICLSRTVAAAADCRVTVTTQSFLTGQLVVPVIHALTAVNGVYNLSFPTQNGNLHTVQYKDALSDPNWIDLGTVTGTGANMSITDPAAAQRPKRFYRIMSTPQ